MAKVTHLSPNERRPTAPLTLSNILEEQADTAEGNPLMVEAWIGCIEFLSTKSEVIAEFETDTGLRWPKLRRRTGIETMIDKAAGFDPEVEARKVFEAFIDWATKWYWGPEKGGSGEL